VLSADSENQRRAHMIGLEEGGGMFVFWLCQGRGHLLHGYRFYLQRGVLRSERRQNAPGSSGWRICETLCKIEVWDVRNMTVDLKSANVCNNTLDSSRRAEAVPTRSRVTSLTHERVLYSFSRFVRRQVLGHHASSVRASFCVRTLSCPLQRT